MMNKHFVLLGLHLASGPASTTTVLTGSVVVMFCHLHCGHLMVAGEYVNQINCAAVQLISFEDPKGTNENLVTQAFG